MSYLTEGMGRVSASSWITGGLLSQIGEFEAAFYGFIDVVVNKLDSPIAKCKLLTSLETLTNLRDVEMVCRVVETLETKTLDKNLTTKTKKVI